MFEARRLLEVGMAALAAERATSDQIATMAEEVTGMFASVDDPQTFLMHDIRFHRPVAMASGNPILATLVEMVSTLYFEHRRRTLPRGEQLRNMAIMHRNIYHAVRAHDPERARREMSMHLPRPAAHEPAEPLAAGAVRWCRVASSPSAPSSVEGNASTGAPRTRHSDSAGRLLDVRSAH